MLTKNVVVLVDLKTPKSPFEINWPLAISSADCSQLSDWKRTWKGCLLPEIKKNNNELMGSNHQTMIVFQWLFFNDYLSIIFFNDFLIISLFIIDFNRSCFGLFWPSDPKFERLKLKYQVSSYFIFKQLHIKKITNLLHNVFCFITVSASSPPFVWRPPCPQIFWPWPLDSGWPLETVYILGQ